MRTRTFNVESAAGYQGFEMELPYLEKNAGFSMSGVDAVELTRMALPHAVKTKAGRPQKRKIGEVGAKTDVDEVSGLTIDDLKTMAAHLLK